MDQIIWITLPIIAAIIIVILCLVKFQRSCRTKKNVNVPLKPERTPRQALTSIAISLVVLGIVFGTDRLVSYSFFGAGVIISIFSIIQNKRTT